MHEKLITRAQVEDRVGMTKVAIYRAMRECRFPEPLRIGRRGVRWLESEISAWIASRPRARGDKGA